MLVVYDRRLASFSYMLHMPPIEMTYLQTRNCSMASKVEMGDSLGGVVLSHSGLVVRVLGVLGQGSENIYLSLRRLGRNTCLVPIGRTLI